MEIADILVNNNKSFSTPNGEMIDVAIEEYGQKLLKYVKLIESPGNKEPTFDELYMHHACSVALRSTCLKRQVGAVIIKERYKNINNGKEKSDNGRKKGKPIATYMIAAGYNNVPIGAGACGTVKEGAGSKCYRDFKKEEYLAETNFCRKCGTEIKNGLRKCTKCGYDVLDFPGKILDLCRAVHAEEASVLQAARLGTSLEGAILYTSTFPCLLCSKKIIGCGITEIIYLESYPMEESLAMLRECGILIRKYEGVNSRAFNRLFLKEL